MTKDVKYSTKDVIDFINSDLAITGRCDKTVCQKYAEQLVGKSIKQPENIVIHNRTYTTKIVPVIIDAYKIVDTFYGTKYDVTINDQRCNFAQRNLKKIFNETENQINYITPKKNLIKQIKDAIILRRVIKQFVNSK
ncbi:hypothetical protein LJC18_00825 [Lachnospiraceae bacterium OttesenSCG-928-E19]|nr:hypothetical protein [Lachnospiraceae bacterium OttesenSCG-928-E19]